MLRLFLTTLDTSKNIINNVAESIANQNDSVFNDIEKLKPENIINTLYHSLPTIINFIYQILFVIIILFISSKLIHYAILILKKFLNNSKFDIGVRKFLLSLFKALAYTVVILVLAIRLGINSASILAILGSAGIAVGLALQGSLSNFAGGILILIMKPFVIGDYIITPQAEGSVYMIGLIYTTIITYDNKKITMPNGSLSNGIITNLTANEERMLEIKIGVAYSSDIDFVKSILHKVLISDSSILKDREIICFLNSFEASSIIMGLRAWCPSKEFNITKWRIQENIKREFDKNGIEIPFNQLEVKLK